MIFGSEVPVGVSFEVFGWFSVKSFETVSSIDVSQPLLEGHLILEKSKNGLNIVDWRTDNRNVSEKKYFIHLNK